MKMGGMVFCVIYHASGQDVTKMYNYLGKE